MELKKINIHIKKINNTTNYQYINSYKNMRKYNNNEELKIEKRQLMNERNNK